MVSNEEIKKIILLRLETMPDNIKVSIGSEGEFSKQELINEVKEETKLGKMIIEIQLEYLRAMKTGFRDE